MLKNKVPTKPHLVAKITVLQKPSQKKCRNSQKSHGLQYITLFWRKIFSCHFYHYLSIANLYTYVWMKRAVRLDYFYETQIISYFYHSARALHYFFVDLHSCPADSGRLSALADLLFLLCRIYCRAFFELIHRLNQLLTVRDAEHIPVILEFFGELRWKLIQFLWVQEL